MEEWLVEILGAAMIATGLILLIAKITALDIMSLSWWTFLMLDALMSILLFKIFK